MTPSTRPVEVGPYAALGFGFSVRTDVPDLGSYLASVFRPLAGSSSQLHRYELLHVPQRRVIEMTLDGTSVGSAGMVELAADHVIWDVNRRAVASWPTVVLHGGAVTDSQGSAVVVVGDSGAGKSTLTASLVLAGHGYLSDELVPLDAGGSTVHAYRHSISLKPGSWPLLPELAPDPADGHARFRTGQWHVDPGRITEMMPSSAQPRLLVLLDVTPAGTGVDVAPVRAAEVVVRLARQSFGLAEAGQAGLDAIAHLATSVPAARLRGGGRRERLEAVLGLLEDDATYG